MLKSNSNCPFFSKPAAKIVQRKEDQVEQLSLSSAAWVICGLTQAKQRIDKTVLMGLGTKGSNEDLRDSRIKEKGAKS